MGKPNILAKGSLTKEQLDVKLSIGCDGLEVQLLGELIEDREKGYCRQVNEVFDLGEFVNYPVTAVHAPLTPGQGDVLLEDVCSLRDVGLLESIFKIANYFGKMQDKRVICVMHTETSLEGMRNLDDIIDCLTKVLYRYKCTELAIENVSPLRGVGKGQELHLANNFAFDNVKLVKTLRKGLETDRVGTCLDTCHAMLSDKYVTGLMRMMGDVEVPDLSMERYFKENREYLKLIHLCDIKGSGYGKGRHGIPFQPARYGTLSHILDLYSKYGCKCPITLEVEETDYSVCDGYRITKELVDMYYG